MRPLTRMVCATGSKPYRMVRQAAASGRRRHPTYEHGLPVRTVTRSRYDAMCGWTLGQLAASGMRSWLARQAAATKASRPEASMRVPALSLMRVKYP